MLYVGPGILNARFETGSDIIAKGDTLLLGPINDVSGGTSAMLGYFRFFGKMIFLYNMGIEHAATYRKAMMGLLVQGNPGDADAYPPVTNVIIPYVRQNASLVNSVDGTAPMALRYIRNYVRHQVRPDLGLPDNITVESTLTALVNEMALVNVHVLAGGEFASYFLDNFDVTLPTDADPEIDENWISDVYVDPT
jgi:hypothetical protein